MKYTEEELEEYRKKLRVLEDQDEICRKFEEGMNELSSIKDEVLKKDPVEYIWEWEQVAPYGGEPALFRRISNICEYLVDTKNGQKFCKLYEWIKSVREEKDLSWSTILGALLIDKGEEFKKLVHDALYEVRSAIYSMECSDVHREYRLVRRMVDTLDEVLYKRASEKMEELGKILE